MMRFAALLDRLSYSASRNAKLKLIADYMRAAPDPDRGYALAVLTGELSFAHAKPRLIRQLIAERFEPHLFELSYDYVGDLSETVALLWPAGEAQNTPAPTLSSVVEALQSLPANRIGEALRGWLDSLDETGRWALLKMMTGALRVGVSSRLAKTALAGIGGREPDEIEEVWPGLDAPYTELFAWLEGRGPRPAAAGIAFKSPMLSHPIDEAILATLDPAAFSAEWKWDGIRVQALGVAGGIAPKVQIFTRTGDDITHAFPDVAGALRITGAAIDGELLVVREGRVQPFSALQQRLNRKSVSAKMMAEFPAHIRAYDLLAEEGEDLRALPFAERRRRLEAFITGHTGTRLDLSPLIAVSSREEIAAARRDPAAFGGGADSEAIEGVMLKERTSPYLTGRPRGPWWKWKRDPHNVDAVLMYAQRGHGKRSSFYSDYTFGVWREGALVPVGKAYFGFTDEELKEIDRFVRNNTINRFGPVREVRHAPDHGLVFEVAFEGLNRSGRNKSGLAMRFPRIARIRWDKTPSDAGTIAELEQLLR
jgi:DNA ligase-1